jgi:DNA-binding NarL/FixJ family response regulator
VFFLLAKGRNRAYIREELVIGDETVKSHVKSIYRKTDVHSQQELIDLLERESSADEARGRG